MGEALSTKGNYSKALETQLKALQLAEKSGDHLRISSLFCGLEMSISIQGTFRKPCLIIIKLNQVKNYLAKPGINFCINRGILF